MMRRMQRRLLFIQLAALALIVIATATVIVVYGGSALSQFSSAPEPSPKLLNHLQQAARKQLEAGKYQESLSILRRLRQVMPDNPDLQRIQLLANFRQGNCETARMVAIGLLRRFPNDPVIHNNLGEILIREGQIHDGLHHLLSAGELDPNCPQIQHNLSTIYSHIGKYELAAKYQNRANLIWASNAAIPRSDLIVDALPLPQTPEKEGAKP